MNPLQVESQNGGGRRRFGEKKNQFRKIIVPQPVLVKISVRRLEAFVPLMICTE